MLRAAGVISDDTRGVTQPIISTGMVLLPVDAWQWPQSTQALQAMSINRIPSNRPVVRSIGKVTEP